MLNTAPQGVACEREWGFALTGKIALAWYAEKLLALRQTGFRSIVAMRAGVEKATILIRNVLVKNVEKYLETSAVRRESFVVVSAPRPGLKDTCGNTIAAVYNLQVDEHPEFFANGVLVHNCLMMQFQGLSLTATALTQSEKVNAAIPAQLQYANLLAESPHERGLTPAQELGFTLARMEAKKRIRPKRQKFDDYGRLMAR